MDNDEINKRRKEECERKARRGEMDPRLEFTFQMLIDATGLPRAEIMDYVFEGDMLDEINQLFQPHMRNKLLWFYQDAEEPEPPPQVEQAKPVSRVGAAPGGVPGKVATSSGVAGPSGVGGASSIGNMLGQHAPPPRKKRLFLTDGWQEPLTGLCIYMFRLNTSKQLPEEGFHKDLYCGVIDAENVGLVTSIERVVEHVFMEALAHPGVDGDAEEESCCATIQNQLLPGLRSFCSALRVCEEVCEQVNLFEDESKGSELNKSPKNMEEAQEMSKVPEDVARFEELAKIWIKRVNEVLMESEQLRRENDASGPQDELEYWKRRGAQFSQIVAHLQAQEVQMVLLCLQLSHSRIFKQWQETDKKITFCYNEARDNAKFIQAMEKCCHCLYLHDPVKMKDSLLSLLQTVRLIHSVSQFYNTSERTSSLMIKITNQMIETCKSYITCRGKETIWTQSRDDVRERLRHCVQLNRIYRETYYTVKEEQFLPGRIPFGFSENYVFGKFDSFCERLNNIISLFDLIDDYNSLFERRMEALEEAMKTFDDAKKGVTAKNYDYLDHRNKEFDNDLQNFLMQTDQLKESISELIESNFANVWETPQGIRFLLRFEKVSEKIPLSHMDEKYDRVLKYCEKEVDRILKMFRRQRDDPPLPRYFPPIAGRIKWVRSLKSHLEDMVESISSHPVLRVLPTTSELLRKHTAVCATLTTYENEVTTIWMNHNVWVVDECLSKKILCLCPDTGRLKVNLDQRIRLLIREAGCLAKMSISIPIVTLTLLSKQDYFTTVNDSMQLLLNQFLTTVRRVKLEVRPLFLPQLVRLTALLTPGLNTIKWTDPSWKPFYTSTLEAVKQFDVLVTRVHDVYTNRILQVLSGMQKVTLHILPDEEPWSVEEFVERTEGHCIQAALELNRKSLMVEEAVEEILELVKRAALAFKGNSGQDIFEFLTEGSSDEQEGVGESGGGNHPAGEGNATGTQGPSEAQAANSKKQGSQGEGGSQQQDWSAVWACFDEPHTLLQQAGGIGLSKGMQQMVRNAVSEMRRYYSRKVVDVLTRVTRQSLDTVRRRFTLSSVSLNDSGASCSGTVSLVFLLHGSLMIPNVIVRPSLEEVQEALITVGKCIAGVSKGVSQWTGGKGHQVKVTIFCNETEKSSVIFLTNELYILSWQDLEMSGIRFSVDFLSTIS